MKKILISLLVLTITTSSFASCIDSYEYAADRRDTSNGILLTVGAIATVVTAAVLTDDNDSSASTTSSSSRRNTRRARRRHHRHSYGVYYIHTYDNDGRWLGTNNFDRVLMAYNDAVVSSMSTDHYGTSSELYEFERVVAKKTVRIARRAGQSNKVSDIKASKRLSYQDTIVLRDALMRGMEDSSSNGFCAGGKAMRRNKLIKRLAKKVLEAR